MRMPKEENIGAAEDFDLQAFFPYLVRVFYAQITTAVSMTYRKEYDISPAEWRSMAIVGPSDSMTANDVVTLSSMDKVSVSRAVARLKKNGLLEISPNRDDGRSKLLRLSAKGRRVHADIALKVLEVEQKLLFGIEEDEKQAFVDTMTKILENKKEFLL